MATILRYGNVRVVIYGNDHAPEHVHVIAAEWEAVFDLRCPHGPPTLRESFRATSAQCRRAHTEILAHLAVLCRAWGEIHGQA